MTGVAAVALLVVVAIWMRPRPEARHGRPRTRVRTHRRRRSSPTVDEWAALLDAMSSEVRTGSSLATAFDRAVDRCRPHGQVLSPAATLASIDAGGVSTDPDEVVAVQALRSAHALGGPTAATLDAAATLLRERAAIRGEALAYSAQARLSARVLTGVPLAFAAWSAVSSRAFRSAVISPIGMTSALIGAVCNLVGWWWMRRIVAKAVA